MKEYKIVVKIDEDAKVNMEAHGFKGGKCLEEMEKLLEDITMVMEVDKKPEFEDQLIIRGKTTLSRGLKR